MKIDIKETKNYLLIIFCFFLISCLPKKFVITDMKVKWSKAQKEFVPYKKAMKIGSYNQCDFEIIVGFDQYVAMKDLEAHFERYEKDIYTTESSALKIKRITRKNKQKLYDYEYKITFTLKRGDQAENFDYLSGKLRISHRYFFRTLRIEKDIKVITK